MRNRQWWWALAVLGLLGGCGGGGGGGDDGGAGGGAGDAKAYVAALPGWDSFAPATLAKDTEGVETEDPATPASIEDVTDGARTLTCTTRKVSFHDTPKDYAMFSPPRDVLYPGALVQGRSLRDGTDASKILPLLINERKDVAISIPACKINDNSRTVAPTLDGVNQAIASIIGSGQQQGAQCIEATGNIEVYTYRNDAMKALKVGVSGRYYGFSAKADVAVSKAKTENGVSVRFTEQLYRAQYQPPGGAAIFSDAFTQARLDALRQASPPLIGPDNVPVYVAEVVYGRMLDFSMVSSATETEMQAAVQAAYGFAGGALGSVEGKVDTRSRDILKSARYSAAWLGGSAAATSAMLKSLNWGDYFAVKVRAEDAVPIAFTLRNLSDNAIAAVQELTSYNLTSCTEKLADNATFAFGPEQTFTPDFGGAGQLVQMADVDGVHGKDIVLAGNVAGHRGELRVLLSNGDGTFAAPLNADVPGAVTQSGDLQIAAGDVDGDGRDDIIVNTRDNTAGNRVHVVFYRNAAFVHSAPQDLGGAGAWTHYRLYVAQMDGLRGVDLVWNNVPVSTTVNTTYIAHAVDTGAAGFDLAAMPLFVRSGGLNHFASNFSGYEHVHVADFNGDGRADIVWQNMDSASGNLYYIALGTTAGLNFGGSSQNNTNFRNFGSQWSLSIYTALAGDTTGGGRADLVQPRYGLPFNEAATNSNVFGIFVSQGSASSAKAYTDSHVFQLRDKTMDAAIADLLGRGTTAVKPDMLLGDVDGDGRQDLIINDRAHSDNLVNRVGVGLGSTPGSFT
ncbi:MAG: thiol-activated cytolysin family protein, partial [Bacteroidia bacterium]